MFTADVHRTIERESTVQAALATKLMADPPRMNIAIRPLIEAANAAGVSTNEKNRARWLADLADPKSGLATRRDRLIEMLRDTGLWLHPEGTLEDVLGIVKGQAEPADAAALQGRIDAVTAWCAYDLNPLGNLEHLLGAEIERIANGVTHALRVDPDTKILGPVGPMRESDSELVEISPISAGRYRITVKHPDEFRGHFAEFDRETPPSGIRLTPPESPASESSS